MIQAPRHWRHHLLPQEFVIFSNHEVLKYISSQKNLNIRHGRWIEFLQNYTYTLRHKGVENKAVDALNRRLTILTILSNQVVRFEKIKTEYESCPDFQEIFTLLNSGTTREIDGFLVQDGYLFRFRKLCIPRTSVREFLV